MVKIGLYPLSEQEFIKIIKNHDAVSLAGGALKDINIFRVNKRQSLNGAGILDTFASIGRFLFPSIRKHVGPAVSDFAKGMTSDLISGKKFKESLKTRGKKGLKQVGKSFLTGRGIKRKAKTIKKKSKKMQKIGRGVSKISKKKSKKTSARKKNRPFAYSDIFS